MQSEISINFQNHRLQLKKWQYARHYYIVIFPILLFILIEINLKESISSTSITCIVILSTLFFFRQRQLLKFKTFKVNCTHQQLVSAMERSAKSLDWKIEYSKTILYAFDKDRWDWRYNSGWLIIIAQTDEGFIFNSLSDPRKAVAPLFRPFFNFNKGIFTKHLKDVILDKAYNEEFPQLENEWTVKKILTRLFLYPLSLIILWLAFYLITSNEAISPKSLIAIIITSVVVAIYLYFDVRAILKK